MILNSLFDPDICDEQYRIKDTNYAIIFWPVLQYEAIVQIIHISDNWILFGN